MDLLGSILGSMDKPPSASEKEKKIAEACRREKEKAEKKVQKEMEAFKKDIEKKVGKFISDSKETRLKLPPASKVNRALVHDIAEANGLISHSFGTEEVDRHLVLFKKEYPPSEDELQALRNGEEYIPSKDKPASTSSFKSTNSKTAQEDPISPRQLQAPSYGGTTHYQNKYKHLLGGLDCAEKTAVKLEPNRAFGYVPSSNKRDLRSIEQTLNDMKSRKRPRLDNSDPNEQKTTEHSVNTCSNERTS
uniref:Sperm associated antigen n=1 Tax=Suberites domuncula TaxID=55567 RepID=Q5K4G4_SUBDO|nr:sperm associated antigen [Suberites domuncula]